MDSSYRSYKGALKKWSEISGEPVLETRSADPGPRVFLWHHSAENIHRNVSGGFTVVFHIFHLVAVLPPVHSRRPREMAAEMVAKMICWLCGHTPLTFIFFSCEACLTQRKSSWISVLYHLLPFLSLFIWCHHYCPRPVHLSQATPGMPEVPLFFSYPHITSSFSLLLPSIVSKILHKSQLTYEVCLC